MSRKQHTLTLSVSEEEKLKFEKRAAENGCFYGQVPSMSQLVKDIANGEIILSRPDIPKERERYFIREAIGLIQGGLSILQELI